MPLPIGLVKEAITNLDQANRILADAHAEGKRAVVVDTNSGRTLRIVKAQNWIQKFAGAVSGQNQREQGRLEQFLNGLHIQGASDRAAALVQTSLQERSIKVVDTPTAEVFDVPSKSAPRFLAKSTARIFEELRSSHADSPIRDFLVRNRISRFSEQGSLVCDLYDRLIASEMLLLESNLPKPTKDAWGVEMGGIRLSDPQFAYILARIEEAVEKNEVSALGALLDNPGESSSLENSSIKGQLDIALKGKDYDLWETVGLIKQLRQNAHAIATPSSSQPNVQATPLADKSLAPAVTMQVPESVSLIATADVLAMPKQDFNRWLADQLKNQHLEPLWRLAPELIAQGNYIRAEQIKFGVKLVLAERALSVNKASLGWTGADVKERARLVATKTSDLTRPNSHQADICQFNELDRRIKVQMTAIESGLTGNLILDT
jgi:hypothetical protein